MWLNDLFKKYPKSMLIAAILLYFLAQSLAWFQINGQFLMSLIGVPISYLFIKATDLTFRALEGTVWPGRILTFACGIVVFTILTYTLLGEAITWKTGVSLLLTCIIILLQIF